MILIKDLLKKIFELRKLRKKNLLLKILKEAGGLSLLDIGAAGDIEPRWLSISKELDYTAFEPDKRSVKKLSNSHNCKKYEIIEKAVWDSKKDIVFNLCNDPQVSSSLKPNKKLLDKFPEPHRFNIKKTISVFTSTIDDELYEKNIDFVKLDIQGGEYYALKGMKNKLKNCLGLEIEVEFSNLYNNQPLFGDLDNFLKNQDFEFIDFTNIYRWDRKVYNSFGQAVFGDGLWLRSPEFIVKNHQEKAIKYIAICCIYGRLDLAIIVLEILKPNLSNNFYKSFNKLKNSQKRKIKINYLINLIIKFFDGQDTTISHLIY